MKIFWTRLALKDLDHVWNYISEDNSQAADAMLEKIEKSVKALLSYHNLGRIGRLKGTRELIVAGSSYVVPYRVKNDQIQILAILHASRRWPEGFKN